MADRDQMEICFGSCSSGILPAGSWPLDTRAISQMHPTERPFSAYRPGNWLEDASTPVAETVPQAYFDEPVVETVQQAYSDKPFAAGGSPGWREAASTSM